VIRSEEPHFHFNKHEMSMMMMMMMMMMMKKLMKKHVLFCKHDVIQLTTIIKT
jgi:hypothetical protein